MTNSKMTYVSALSYVLENCDLPADVKEKLSALAVQQGKRSSAERKPTAHQVANEGLKTLITDFLADGQLRTITQIVKGIDWGEVEMSTNRCSALVRQLKEAGIVSREEIKRTAYFTLASAKSEAVAE